MAQYLLLLHEDLSQYRDFSPEEIQKVIEEYQAWAEGLAGQDHLVGGEKLMEETRILRQSEGRVLLDGPLSESKEVVGGFFMIKAADFDQAQELASSCPHLGYGGRIEIREVDPT